MAEVASGFSAYYLLLVALTDILPRQPVILSFSDTFTRPCPFQADVVVGIDEVIERKLDMVHCHVSQVSEYGARPDEKAIRRLFPFFG